MDFKIPANEQNGVMETFWTMLRECETKADCDDDRVLVNRVTQVNALPLTPP